MSLERLPNQAHYIVYERTSFDPAYSVAVDRARALLARHLTPVQRRQWDEHQAIDVRGSEGGRFQVAPRTVLEYHSLNNVTHWCLDVGAGLGVPVWDIILGRKLLLEADELRFKRIARRSPSPYTFLKYNDDVPRELYFLGAGWEPYWQPGPLPMPPGGY